MAAFIFTWKVVAAAAAPDMSRTVGKDGKQKEEKEEEEEKGDEKEEEQEKE